MPGAPGNVGGIGMVEVSDQTRMVERQTAGQRSPSSACSRGDRTLFSRRVYVYTSPCWRRGSGRRGGRKRAAPVVHRLAGAATPHEDDLGEDADGDLFGRLRADIEADRRAHAVERLAGVALLGKMAQHGAGTSL